MMIMLNSTRGVCRCVPVGLPWPWSVRNRVSNSRVNYARNAVRKMQSNIRSNKVRNAVSTSEAFRRMSCRMFRVHRVAVSRDPRNHRRDLSEPQKQCECTG